MAIVKYLLPSCRNPAFVPLNKCKKYILQLVEQHGNNYIDRNKVFKNILVEYF